MAARVQMIKLFRKMEMSRGMKRVVRETGYNARQALGF